MLVIRYNPDGFICAYGEYHIVDDKGNFKDDGKFCFVRECWIHPTLRLTKNLLKDMTREVHETYKHLEYIYFQRRKYQDRMYINRMERFYGRK